ncbi:PASTA domain-containing protein [Blattabacterium cuenoti]|uniref:PASTA domain-containing protein n=1 Tax=Blattabacterium cuenoti TaxID=1653831 RepID=UPI00163C81A5|nr:PASTA domain-containing protein [Blattabacterium cuenoti]
MKLKHILIIIINILFSIFILYKITQITSVWTDMYTKHGTYVVVPNLRYFNLSKSISILKKLGLRYYIENLPDNNIVFNKNNKVISVNPKSGTHVKEGRRISIWIDNKSKNIILPNIIYKNKYKAIKILRKKNIHINKIIYINNLPKEKVLKVIFNKKFIYPGYIIPFYKNKITLLVGNGLNKDKLVMPNIIGMSLNKAISILKNKSFSFITYHCYYEIPNNYKLYTYDNKKNKVLRQNPSPGVICNKKINIEIWIKNSKKSIK